MRGRVGSLMKLSVSFTISLIDTGMLEILLYHSFCKVFLLLIGNAAEL